MKKLVFGAAAICLISAAYFVFVPMNTHARAELMLHGYDPVSYFVAEAPVIGSSDYAVEHNGARYHFVSEQNREAFLSAPDKFKPEYDGHCSYGVSLGQVFEIDPLAYRIVGERLFLQLDAGTRDVWMEAEQQNIQLADRNWPQLKTATN